MNLTFRCVCTSSQKLKMRKATLAKTNGMTVDQKERWAPCVVAEMQSSEDSASDSESDQDSDVGGESGTRSAKFVVRPLPWRSEKVELFFTALDRKSAKTQTNKSSQMTLQRTKGLPSDRPRPDGFPTWAVKP